MRTFSSFSIHSGAGAMVGLILMSVPQIGLAARKAPKTVVEHMMSAAEQALVPAPKDLEVCFSPEEPCDAKLLKFMKAAEKSLDVAIYDITLDQVAHTILVLSKKIPVRVLVDRKQAAGDHSLVPLLVKAGAQVKLGRQRGIMHNKFTIVDGKAVETGSFNYSMGAAYKNSENQIYLHDPNVVRRYRDRFEELWAAADPSSKLKKRN